MKKPLILIAWLWMILPGSYQHMEECNDFRVKFCKDAVGPITFTDVTVKVGLDEPLKGVNGHSVAWGDINNDTYPDLFVGTFATHANEKYAYRGHGAYPEPDKLLLNHGGARFSKATPSPTQVMGMSSGQRLQILTMTGTWTRSLHTSPIQAKIITTGGAPAFIAMMEGAG